MRIAISQIYITPGISFPFSHLFQRWMSEELTAIVRPSANFIRRYGEDVTLVVNLSAKADIQTVEIKGPTVFKKTKDVEYTVFLPYDRISEGGDSVANAVRFLLDGVISVLESLEINTTQIARRIELIIHHVCSDPSMIKKLRR